MTYIDYNMVANNFLNALHSARNQRLQREQIAAQAQAAEQKVLEQTNANYHQNFLRGQAAAKNLRKAKVNSLNAKRTANEAAKAAAERRLTVAQDEWKLWYEAEGKKLSPNSSELQFQSVLVDKANDILPLARATYKYFKGQGQDPTPEILIQGMINPDPRLKSYQEQIIDFNKSKRADQAAKRDEERLKLSQGRFAITQAQESRNAAEFLQKTELNDLMIKKRQNENSLFPYEKDAAALGVETQHQNLRFKSNEELRKQAEHEIRLENARYKGVGDPELIPFLKINGVDPENITPQDIQQAMADKVAADGLITEVKETVKSTVKRVNERPPGPMVSLLGGYKSPFMKTIAQQNGVNVADITNSMMKNAGVSIIGDVDARQLLKRKAGTSDVISIGNELITNINNYQELTRGGVGGIPNVLLNVQNAYRGIKTLFGYNVDGKTYDSTSAEDAVGQFRQLMADRDVDQYVPTVFTEIAGGHQKGKILTLQLAFALAASEGLEGRAVTESILAQRFLPMASASVQNPKVAVKLLRDVMGISVSRYQNHELNLLGVNTADFNIDKFKMTTNLEVIPQTNTNQIVDRAQNILADEYDYLLGQ